MKRAAIAIAAGLALADASIVTLGLPSILVELDSTIEGVALVLGVYVAVLAIALPFVPRLASRIGPARLAVRRVGRLRRRLAGCGAVSSLEPLLVLRAVQALGGAARPGRRLRTARRRRARAAGGGCGSPPRSSAPRSARRSAGR